MARACVTVAALAALGACKTAPTDPVPAPAPAGAVAPPAGTAPTPPAATTAPAAVVPLPADEIRAALDSVRSMLDQGQEDSALELVRRILATDANHRLANSYLRQIKDDPQAQYGAESSSYRVVAGDTLASIALRFMKDRDQFYGLARYNDIRVPRQLHAGQVIKVPGKGVVAAAATSPPTPNAAAGATTGPTAPSASPGIAGPPPSAAPAPPAPAQPAPVAVPPAPSPAPPVVDVKQQIDRCTREARRARERHDLCTAIDRWSCVLQLDPTNKTAQQERERAVDLNRKLPNPAC